MVAALGLARRRAGGSAGGGRSGGRAGAAANFYLLPILRMGTVWRKFLWPFALTFAAGLAIPFALVLLADPYGVSPVRAISPEVVVPTQRRFIVADIIRSGRYDSFIVGTSTVNSIDPAWLEAAFGGRFANVAVHGATP